MLPPIPEIKLEQEGVAFPPPPSDLGSGRVAYIGILEGRSDDPAVLKAESVEMAEVPSREGTVDRFRQLTKRVLR